MKVQFSIVAAAPPLPLVLISLCSILGYLALSGLFNNCGVSLGSKKEEIPRKFCQTAVRGGAVV
jgi:hypothetical protein